MAALAVHYLNGLGFLSPDIDVGVRFSIIPAIIGAVGALGASAIGGALSSSSTKKANKMQLQMQREQNQWNLEQWNRERAFTEMMWDRENAYNSASAQRQRLEQAGLNPYLMLNGANAGVASSASTPAGSPASPAFQPQVPNYSWISDMVQQAAGMFGQVLDFKSKNLDNQMKETQAQYQEMQILKALEKMTADTENVRADTRRKAQEAANLIVEENLKRAQLKAQDWTNEHLDRNFNMQVQEFNSNMATADIMRQMQIKANDRAEREVTASIKNLLAAAYQATEQGNLAILQGAVAEEQKKLVRQQVCTEKQRTEQETVRNIKMPRIIESEIFRNNSAGHSRIWLEGTDIERKVRKILDNAINWINNNMKDNKDWNSPGYNNRY